MKPKYLLRAAVLSALVFTLSGCVEDIGEIDRTQANALKKSDFNGVWYRLSTITDMPISANFGFVGLTHFADTGGKVVLDIQENHLVVYPFTETVRDGDAKWNRRKIRTYWVEGEEDKFVELLVGNPVAMYPITTHFDIIRKYSSSTGAQSNVLVENTTDNPWYKRKYMRVNWLGNTLIDLRFSQGSVAVSPVDYYIQEHDVDPGRFNMEKGYFHYTQRMFGQPMSTGACSTYSLAGGDCSGATFDVRVAFRRTNPREINDYDVREYYDNPDADKFGYFLAARHTYDEDYGLTYAGQDHKAQIWNLWTKSKTFEPVKDANDQPIKCLSNADCEAPTVCDQEEWFQSGFCSIGTPIEYSQRGHRPVIYHLSADHPKGVYPALYKVADNWDDVFKETTSWLLFWEQKWAKNDIKGFDGLSTFGQRFCKTHDDCSKHAVLSSNELADLQGNNLVVGTAKGAVVVRDNTKTRPKLGGDAYIILVNATPDSPAPTLTVGSIQISGAEFKAGVIDGQATAKLLPKAEAADRLTLSLKAGDKTITVPNVEFQSNRIHHVVYFGGDGVKVLRAPSLTKTGVRVLHGISSNTVETNGKSYSVGDTLQVGLNGVRNVEEVPYGEVIGYMHFTGND
jgi:hypothetical protein